MKNKFGKIISIVLCFAMIFGISCTGVVAADEPQKTEIVEKTPSADEIRDEIYDLVGEGMKVTADTMKYLFAGFCPVNSFDDFLNSIVKVLYNALNIIVEVLVNTLCRIYPDPGAWKDLGEYKSENFLEGRPVYSRDVKEGNYWTLGYSSRSLIPEDVANGKYYIGRDLLNKKAVGVYDDQRVRVAVLDDNSGYGAVVIASIDSLGVTSTDARSIRAGVLAYCKENNIAVSSINVMSTHAHSVLDTQGVSTEFFYKLLANGVNNRFEIFEELPFIESATYFKEYFVEQSIIAVEEAFSDMEKGSLYFSAVDASEYIKDKRGLVAKEDIPDIASLYFEPDNGNEGTFIANLTCHPTSFSASHGYIGSDFIYYMDEYIKETTGANFLMFQGAVGQISRDISVDTTGMTEYEAWAADPRYLGRAFAKLMVEADYSRELAPIINAHHKEIFVIPGNSILALACEVKLVNNQVFYSEDGAGIISEVGYLEFGHEIGFALFPGELYPEVFWGSEIVGNVNWDGTGWDYPALDKSVEGVQVYGVSLANDAIGYVLTDNNYAFMGHIIGDGIADEVLSAGKHIGSYLVSSYLALIEDYVK